MTSFSYTPHYFQSHIIQRSCNHPHRFYFITAFFWNFLCFLKCSHTLKVLFSRSLLSCRLVVHMSQVDHYRSCTPYFLSASYLFEFCHELMNILILWKHFFSYFHLSCRWAATCIWENVCLEFVSLDSTVWIMIGPSLLRYLSLPSVAFLFDYYVTLRKWWDFKDDVRSKGNMLHYLCLCLGRCSYPSWLCCNLF